MAKRRGEIGSVGGNLADLARRAKELAAEESTRMQEPVESEPEVGAEEWFDDGPDGEPEPEVFEGDYEPPTAPAPAPPPRPAPRPPAAKTLRAKAPGVSVTVKTEAEAPPAAPPDPLAGLRRMVGRRITVIRNGHPEPQWARLLPSTAVFCGEVEANDHQGVPELIRNRWGGGHYYAYTQDDITAGRTPVPIPLEGQPINTDTMRPVEPENPFLDTFKAPSHEDGDEPGPWGWQEGPPGPTGGWWRGRPASGGRPPPWVPPWHQYGQGQSYQSPPPTEEVDRVAMMRLEAEERRRQEDSQRQWLTTLLSRGDNASQQMVQMMMQNQQAEAARRDAEHKERRLEFEREQNRLERERKEREDRERREADAAERRFQLQREDRERQEREERRLREEERKDRETARRFEQERIDKQLEQERARAAEMVAQNRLLFEQQMSFMNKQKDGSSQVFETFGKMLEATRTAQEMLSPQADDGMLGTVLRTGQSLAASLGPALARLPGAAGMAGAALAAIPPPQAALPQNATPVPQGPNPAEVMAVQIASTLTRITDAMLRQDDPQWSLGRLQDIPPLMERLKEIAAAGGQTEHVLAEIQSLQAIMPPPLAGPIQAFLTTASTEGGKVWVGDLLDLLRPEPQAPAAPMPSQATAPVIQAQPSLGQPQGAALQGQVM